MNNPFNHSLNNIPQLTHLGSTSYLKKRTFQQQSEKYLSEVWSPITYRFLCHWNRDFYARRSSRGILVPGPQWPTQCLVTFFLFFMPHSRLHSPEEDISLPLCIDLSHLTNRSVRWRCRQTRIYKRNERNDAGLCWQIAVEICDVLKE